MIKVIREGERQVYARRFECKTCGCVFLADKSEYAGTWDYSTPLVSIVYVCECPCCGDEVRTASKEEIVRVV